MLIPLRTEVEPRRRPRITPALVLANGLVMLLLLLAQRFRWFDVPSVVDLLALRRAGFRMWQPLTYQFVHDLSGIWHLLFNMVFLWVFGCAVEGRMGRLGFLAFYLVGGALAGVVNMLVSRSPNVGVIGASGAVAATCGAFIALFPRAHVRVLVFFFIIGIYHFPAAWLIGVYLAIDLISQTTALLGINSRNVAYAAHLAGYAYGFGVAFLLLALRILPRQDFDIFFLLTQWRRRAAMRAALREGAPWQGTVAPRLRTTSDDASAAPKPPPPPRPAVPPEAAKLRSEISAMLARRALPEAAQTYRRLLRIAPQLVFPLEHQLDLSNQLLADGHAAEAAEAYEQLLRAYPESARADEVRLLLAMIYTRRLSNAERARPLLQLVRPRLRDAGHTALADQLLRELPT